MTVEPQDSDESWLAVDADGHVGWFTVNGAGAVLLRPGVQARQLFAAQDGLSAWIREAGNTFAFGDGEQWKSAANAGLFAFDHSSKAGGYELIASPTIAIPVASLPPSVARIAVLVTLKRIRFETTSLLRTSDLEEEDA